MGDGRKLLLGDAGSRLVGIPQVEVRPQVATLALAVQDLELQREVVGLAIAGRLDLRLDDLHVVVASGNDPGGCRRCDFASVEIESCHVVMLLWWVWWTDGFW